MGRRRKGEEKLEGDEGVKGRLWQIEEGEDWKGEVRVQGG